MKKIIFIVFAFGICFTTYSQTDNQNTNLEKKYDDLKGVEEKLDFIFRNILEKNISDYQSLNKKHENLKEKNSNKNLKKLESDIVSHESTIDIQNSDIRDFKKKIKLKDDSIRLKNKKITTLKTKEEKLSKLNSEEKERVKEEISLILKNKGIISNNLLKITRDRAVLYQIDQKSISELDRYIDINKTIIESQDVLSDVYDGPKINTQLNILKNKNKKTSNNWQKDKVSSLIQLLESYCSKNNDLFYEFDIINDLPRLDNEYIEDLKEKRNFYQSYPFLLDELNKKIKNKKYNSEISECD